MSQINEEAHNGYQENEMKANRHMTFALVFTASLLFIVWFGFIFKLFEVARDTWVATISVIPGLIVLLCIPMIFIKSDLLKSRKYKYFVFILFIFAISALNTIMPKHAVLGWAVCILLTAHYYSPKLTRAVFVGVIIMMLVSLTLGTFVGEFDSNLLAGEINKVEQRIYNVKLPGLSFDDSPAGRFEYLKALKDAGDNRFIKIFTEYFLGRAMFATLIFAITLFLNKRTNTLLESEIAFSNESQKNKTELEVAKQIQLNTLPEEMISTNEVEIIGELNAAKQVGGDLYDYIDIDDDHVAVLIGDVSGKGVPAAMFMMKTITSFRDFATKGKSPAEILKEVNASIHKGNRSSLFVTCFLAILNKKNGKVVYANAGHNPPIIGSCGNYHYLKCKTGFLLGCFKDTFVVDEEITLKPGESLTLYTDGITEARNEKGDFFGNERFLNTLNKKEYTCTIELHHSIKDDLAMFVGKAPQSDDITFVTMTYRGGDYSYREQKFQNAKIENINEMLKFISDFGDKYNFPEDFKNKLVIVGDELFSNIIKYGYKNEGGDIFVRILFNKDRKEFALTVIDRAPEFNQLSVNNEKVGTDAKVQKIGGLGIIIVKKIMTEYAYDRINGKNILVLKKRF